MEDVVNPYVRRPDTAGRWAIIDWHADRNPKFPFPPKWLMFYTLGVPASTPPDAVWLRWYLMLLAPALFERILQASHGWRNQAVCARAKVLQEAARLGSAPESRSDLVAARRWERLLVMGSRCRIDATRAALGAI